MGWLLWLLLAAPVAIAASLLHAAPIVVFAASAIAIVPLSSLLGSATEELSAHTGPTLGGLVNASLGNLAELIIAIFALHAGLIDLVKASITGSIIGNLLLVLGAAQLAGGLKYRTQKFNPSFAGTSISLLVIALVAGAIGWMSELLVGATESTVHALGLSNVFVGLILVPIIGNAAEHSSAVLMARKNRMDLAASIAIGSSVQVALFVAPVLVFVGLIVGQPLDLAFGTFEVASVTLAVWITSAIVLDAESNWLEGAFLLLVYGILGVAFFYF